MALHNFLLSTHYARSRIQAWDISRQIQGLIYCPLYQLSLLATVERNASSSFTHLKQEISTS
jgi:hypothetical protein